MARKTLQEQMDDLRAVVLDTSKKLTKSGEMIFKKLEYYDKEMTELRVMIKALYRRMAALEKVGNFAKMGTLMDMMEGKDEFQESGRGISRNMEGDDG